mgnify:FL=1
MIRRLILAAILVGAGAAGTHAADTRGGVVVRIIDGDTFDIAIEGQGERRVRANHYDTPEHGHLAHCEAERDKARDATIYVRDKLLPPGTVVTLSDFGADGYGRTLATVRRIDGADIAQAMIAAGLAHAYEGGRKRPWCP